MQNIFFRKHLLYRTRFGSLESLEYDIKAKQLFLFSFVFTVSRTKRSDSLARRFSNCFYLSTFGHQLLSVLFLACNHTNYNRLTPWNICDSDQRRRDCLHSNARIPEHSSVSLHFGTDEREADVTLYVIYADRPCLHGLNALSADGRGLVTAHHAHFLPSWDTYAIYVERSSQRWATHDISTH